MSLSESTHLINAVRTEGNVRLRKLIDEYVEEYLYADKAARKAIVSRIIDRVLAKSIVGFVRQDPDTKRWFKVSRRVAREKVGQALRAALKKKGLYQSRKHSDRSLTDQSQTDQSVKPSSSASLEASPVAGKQRRTLRQCNSDSAVFPSPSRDNPNSLSIQSLSDSSIPLGETYQMVSQIAPQIQATHAHHAPTGTLGQLNDRPPNNCASPRTTQETLNYTDRATPLPIQPLHHESFYNLTNQSAAQQTRAFAQSTSMRLNNSSNTMIDPIQDTQLLIEPEPWHAGQNPGLPHPIVGTPHANAAFPVPEPIRWDEPPTGNQHQLAVTINDPFQQTLRGRQLLASQETGIMDDPSVVTTPFGAPMPIPIHNQTTNNIQQNQQGSSNGLNIHQQGGSNSFNIQQNQLGGSYSFSMPEQGGSNSFNMPEQGGSNSFNMPEQGGSNSFNMPEQGGSNSFSILRQHPNIPPDQFFNQRATGMFETRNNNAPLEAEFSQFQPNTPNMQQPMNETLNRSQMQLPSIHLGTAAGSTMGQGSTMFVDPQHNDPSTTSPRDNTGTEVSKKDEKIFKF